MTDKPNWFKTLVAGVSDVISMQINAAANNAFLRTCFTKQALIDICERMGYAIPFHTTSSGTILFYFKPDAAYPRHIDRVNLAATYGGMRFEALAPLDFDLEPVPVTIANDIITIADRATGEKIRFTKYNPTTDYYLIRIDAATCKIAASSKNAFLGVAVAGLPAGSTDTVTLYSAAVGMIQGTYKDAELGKVDTADFPELYLPDKYILPNTLTITANGDDYTIVDTLLFSNQNDEHVQFIRKTNNNASVLFGNNKYGKVPLNADITAHYVYGGGAASNVKHAGMIVNYAGSDSSIEGCANATPFIGGADEENIDSARRVATGALKARDRFVTAEDGEFIAMSLSGISLAKVIPNPYGPLTARVVCIATGGGNPSAQMKSNLQKYLMERSVLSSIAVFVEDADIIHNTISVTANIKSSYDRDFIRNLITIGCKLFFSETCIEIMETYNSTGIDDAKKKISALFGISVSETMNGALIKFFEYLNKFGYRKFDEIIYESQFTAFLTVSIQGINYITVSSPVFPRIFSNIQISGVGSVSVSVSV
ncbi:MAG: baseplate J/gp47 family protein [Treponema sp.]|jgi:hypothetical protein|nr:baseplate J/gp47 family protein [Treponema sp.]